MVWLLDIPVDGVVYQLPFSTNLSSEPASNETLNSIVESVQALQAQISTIQEDNSRKGENP